MALERSDIDQLRIDRSAPDEPRSRGWLLLLLLLLFLLGGAAWWWYGKSRGIEVRTSAVQERAANTERGRTVLNASGYVTARRQATVSSKVTAKVTEVLLEEGMKVEQGQIVARLDTSNVEANLNLADAQMAAAQAALAETKARLDEAELNWRRTQDLAKDKIVSAAEVDARDAELKSVRARLDRQDKEVVVAQRQLGLWKQEMEDRIIRAPFAGIVIAKNAQPGEMISPISAGGGFTRTGIGTIVDMTSLEIEVDVNESFINRVEPGQKVISTLDAYPDWPIPSKVIAIIPAADRQKATVTVRIGFDKLDPRILPDMGIKVAFRDLEPDAAAGSGATITVPQSALHQEGSQEIVFLVQNGRLERRAVKTGPKGHDEVVVLAGLNAGDRVVVEGPPSLKEGDRVTEKK